MYNVSNAYKEAIKKPYKVRRLNGTIGTTHFTEANVADGSLKIDNQCSEGSEVLIGSVYLGHFSCIFRNINLRGQWKGKTITLTEELLLEDNTWEGVPLGVWHVVEANHREDGVYVEAYDSMEYLDKKIGTTTTVGTPYDYLTYIASECDVELAQSEQEIRALPNGIIGFTLYAENELETFRDLLSWVAQTCGCFATCTRYGKIELRLYGNEVVDEIGTTDRWTGGSFSDFVTRYTGVSVVKIEDQSTRYKGLEIDDGLTYNLGSNPLIQNTPNLDAVLGNILTALQRIEYTPFSINKAGSPAYDLGDKFSFPDGIGDGCNGCMMSYDYTFHDAYSMEGYGSNPSLSNARSKQDKQIAGIMKSNSIANRLQIYTFENIKPIQVTDSWKEIIYIRFGSLLATMVIFQAEIKLYADLDVMGAVYDDIIGRIKYVFNDVELEYMPMETWLDGDHVMHLLYFFPIEEGIINRLSVRMKCEHGTLSIGRYEIHAAVSGQGLAATSSWDGYIEVEDEFEEIQIATSPVVVDDYEESITIGTNLPSVLSYTEEIDDIAINTTPEVDEFYPALYLNKGRLKDLTWGTVKDYKWTAEGVQNPVTEDEYAW